MPGAGSGSAQPLDAAEVARRLTGLERLRVAGLMDQARYEAARAGLLAAVHGDATPPPPTAPQPQTVMPISPPTSLPSAPDCPSIGPPSGRRHARAGSRILAAAGIGAVVVSGSLVAAVLHAAPGGGIRLGSDTALAGLPDPGSSSALIGPAGAQSTASTQAAATLAPFSSPSSGDRVLKVLVTSGDLPVGWTAVGAPASVLPGPKSGGGCMPSSLLTGTTAVAGEDYSYQLNSQGLEKGHLLDVVLAFNTADDVSAYMRVVADQSYARCIADEKRSDSAQEGVVPTGSASVQVIPLSPPLNGIHFRVSFPYTFNGASKVAMDDVLYLAEGHLRTRLDLDTCCAPFDSSMVQSLALTIAQRMQSAQR